MELIAHGFNAGITVGLGVACLLLLAVGGWLVRRQRRAVRRDHSLENYHLGKIVRGLFHWTDDFATDVSHYRQVVDSLKRQVRAVELESPHDDPAAVVRLLSRIVQANDMLQQRLDCAEQTLKVQAAEITSYMSEARTDMLTGLPNRRDFDDELSRRLDEYRERNSPVSVLLVDIDHFKKFNDRYGHLAGDAVLRHVAQVLRGTLREPDLVARLGGEEFAILLSASENAESHEAAERARRAVEQAVCQYEGQALRVTVSCGFAQVKQGEDAKGVVNRADQALYAAKAAGRNAVCWHDGRGTAGVPARGASAREAVGCRLSNSSSPRREEFAQVCDVLRHRLQDVVRRQPTG